MKFIFEVKIKEDRSAQDYIEAWKKGSAVIQESEGALGTVLYRKINDQKFLAIASWTSKEARDAAMKKFDQEGKNQEVRKKHNEYGDVKVLGNFEEIVRVEKTRR